ncbi:unnamed protein product, partial [Musa banksii]
MAESLSNVDDDLNNEVSLMVEFYFVMLLCRANKIKISTVRKEDLSPEVSSTCGPCPVARSYAVASTSGCLSCAPAMSYRTLTAHHKCKMMHQEASRRLLFEGINAAAAVAAPSPPGRLASIMCSGFLCGGILFHLQTRVMWSSTRTKGEDDRKEVPPNAWCCGGLCCCRCCYSFTTAIRMDSE